MKYTCLGSTGVTVSRLCLGMMTFGAKAWRDWMLEEDEARLLVRKAIDLGFNFLDTADVCSLGVSEIAAKRGVPNAQVGLAWLLAQPGVTAPIAGTGKPGHLEDAVAALELKPDDEELMALAEPHRLYPVFGHGCR